MNYKAIDVLIFSEKLKAWVIFDSFVTLICAISSYSYLFMAQSRNAVDDDAFDRMYYNLSFGYESVFLIHLILNFFKEYTPDGFGSNAPPVRKWS